MAQSVFDKVGGFSAVSRIIMDFYDRILDSERAGDFFEDVDVPKLIDHQTKFVAYLMGGPASFTDSYIERVHAKLNIDSASFDEMIEILAGTLKDHGLSAADIDGVLSAMRDRRNLIVVR